MQQGKAVYNGENNDDANARLEQIRARIETACARVGRESSDIILVGASKGVSTLQLKKYLESGLQHCGENYVQEGIAKLEVLRPLFPDVKWHLIGALQSNKAREAVKNFDVIHSVDRPSLVGALDKAARELETVQDILLQVNLGNESSKSGCAASELGTLFALCKAKENLRVKGLMCLPPFDENPEFRRPYFRELRRLRDELAGASTLDAPLDLSMGMSNDFEIAIEEGATMIRVGTSLFGAREKRI